MKTTNVKNSDAERIAKVEPLMKALEIILIGSGPQETIVGRKLDEDGDFTIYVIWVSQHRMQEMQQLCKRYELLYYINPSTRHSAREKCPDIVGEGLILEIVFIPEYNL